VECGHHYARAMSSWSVKLALDGFTFSIPEGRLGFAPKVHREGFGTFWSTGTGWGRYTQQPDPGIFKLEVLYGTQTIRRLDLADFRGQAARVVGPEGEIPSRVEGNALILRNPVTLEAGEALLISRDT